MSRCEVSNALYALFDPHHDSDLFDNEVGSGAQTRGIPLNAPDQPAVRVSWIQATAFCEWLSRKTGKKFRLPAEAEWEYACRAGSNQPMWYGKPGADFAAFANFADRSRKGMTGNGAATPDRRAVAAEYDDRAVVSARCGSYAANHWGLYDMHGNVAEWTTSVYRPYPSVGAPVAGAEGMRVVRGGSWDERPVRGTASCRWRYPVWQRLYNVGFRVVCEQ
jgi:formylglycine-generating enzyme required for sulfatase activity